MVLLGWSLVIQRMTSVALFQLFRFVFTRLQRIYWELNGTARQLREATDPQHYHRSAQVLDIKIHVQFCHNQVNSMKDFLCFHNRFEDPQYVIDNEHVTLMMVDEERAYFGVARDKGRNLLSLDLQVYFL